MVALPGRLGERETAAQTARYSKLDLNVRSDEIGASFIDPDVPAN
jgi:hypothetical protein